MKITADKITVYSKVFKGKNGKRTAYSTLISSGKDDERALMFLNVKGKEEILKTFPKTDDKFTIKIKEAYLGVEKYEDSKGKEVVKPIVILMSARVIDEDEDE